MKAVLSWSTGNDAACSFHTLRQNEAYDIASDTWEAYAPMMTPRHGLGAAANDDAICGAGGGPVMGGAIQSAINETFTLG